MKTMLLSFVFPLLFQSDSFINLNQSDHDHQTLLAFLSPLSTESDVSHLYQYISKSGIDLERLDATYEEDGSLHSFNITFTNGCDNSPYTYTGETGFGENTSLGLIAVIFIAEDCSIGVLTTTYSHLKKFTSMFFPNDKPQNLFIGWEGELDRMKK